MFEVGGSFEGGTEFEVVFRIFGEAVALLWRDCPIVSSAGRIGEVGIDLHSVFSTPRSFKISAPKGFAIQILLRIRHVSCVSLTFCKAGMIWMALLPPPMMPIRLPSNSCLFKSLA